MIPVKIAEFLKNRTEPDFFDVGSRAACNDIHDEVTQYVNEGTDVLTLSADAELITSAEAVVRKFGWTLEEATVLFLMWCIACPEEMEAWYVGTNGGERNEENTDAVQA